MKMEKCKCVDIEAGITGRLNKYPLGRAVRKLEGFSGGWEVDEASSERFEMARSASNCVLYVVYLREPTSRKVTFPQVFHLTAQLTTCTAKRVSFE
jgi:hypothetical protein